MAESFLRAVDTVADASSAPAVAAVRWLPPGPDTALAARVHVLSTLNSWTVDPDTMAEAVRRTSEEVEAVLVPDSAGPPARVGIEVEAQDRQVVVTVHDPRGRRRRVEVWSATPLPGVAVDAAAGATARRASERTLLDQVREHRRASASAPGADVRRLCRDLAEVALEFDLALDHRGTPLAHLQQLDALHADLRRVHDEHFGTAHRCA